MWGAAIDVPVIVLHTLICDDREHCAFWRYCQRTQMKAVAARCQTKLKHMHESMSDKQKGEGLSLLRHFDPSVHPCARS